MVPTYFGLLLTLSLWVWESLSRLLFSEDLTDSLWGVSTTIIISVFSLWLSELNWAAHNLLSVRLSRPDPPDTPHRGKLERRTIWLRAELRTPVNILILVEAPLLWLFEIFLYFLKCFLYFFYLKLLFDFYQIWAIYNILWEYSPVSQYLWPEKECVKWFRPEC